MSVGEGLSQRIDLRAFDDDSFVVHFGGALHEVDATTFGHALIALADGLRVINNELNPGHTISITIDAIGPGSFRARLKTVKRSLKNLFSDLPKELIAGVLVFVLVEKVFDPDRPPTIIVEDDHVIVEYDDHTTVIVPKAAFEAKKLIDGNEAVDQAIARTMDIIEQDKSVTSLGFTPNLEDREPVVEIPRGLFTQIIDHALPRPSEDRRAVNMVTSLTVLKAIFEKSRRKWEFIWNGFKISAPITDPTFFDRLARREISLRQGDAFEATVRIWQIRDPLTGAWLNERYEVTSVGNVTFRAPEQPPFPSAE